MSMMYPGGQGVPGANQFMVGGQPNYAAPLVNFSQLNPQQQQKPQPQAQPGGQPNAPSPNGTGKPAAQNGQNPNMANFAAKLRAFFQPGGQQPGAQSNPAGFGPSGVAGQIPAPGAGGAGFGGGAPGGGSSMMQGAGGVSMGGPGSPNFNIGGF